MRSLVYTIFNQNLEYINIYGTKIIIYIYICKFFLRGHGPPCPNPTQLSIFPMYTLVITSIYIYILKNSINFH